VDKYPNRHNYEYHLGPVLECKSDLDKEKMNKPNNPVLVLALVSTDLVLVSNLHSKSKMWVRDFCNNTRTTSAYTPHHKTLWFHNILSLVYSNWPEANQCYNQAHNQLYTHQPEA
jgi:hypothetical protein